MLAPRMRHALTHSEVGMHPEIVFSRLLQLLLQYRPAGYATLHYKATLFSTARWGRCGAR